MQVNQECIEKNVINNCRQVNKVFYVSAVVPLLKNKPLSQICAESRLQSLILIMVLGQPSCTFLDPNFTPDVRD